MKKTAEDIVPSKQGYWDIRPILGYNRPYNFVMSDRGPGKSYNTKYFLIEQPYLFVCIYRQQTDLNSAVGSWLEPILNPSVNDAKHKKGDYKSEQFSWDSPNVHKKNMGLVNLYMDGELKGYFRALTAANTVKQEYFDDYTNWIWFDEFAPEKQVKLAGISNEGRAFEVIKTTVDHDTRHSRESRDLKQVRCLLYANPQYWGNEIISYYQLPKPPGYGIFKHGGKIVIQFVPPVERKRNTRIWEESTVPLMQASSRDNAYIEPIPRGAKPAFSVRIGENYYAGYEDGRSGIIYWKRVRAHITGNDVSYYGTVIGKDEHEQSVDLDMGSGSFIDIIRNRTQLGVDRYVNVATRSMFTQAILSRNALA